MPTDLIWPASSQFVISIPSPLYVWLFCYHCRTHDGYFQFAYIVELSAIITLVSYLSDVQWHFMLLFLEIDFDCYVYSWVCQPAFTFRLWIKPTFSDIELMLSYYAVHHVKPVAWEQFSFDILSAFVPSTFRMVRAFGSSLYSAVLAMKSVLSCGLPVVDSTINKQGQWCDVPRAPTLWLQFDHTGKQWLISPVESDVSKYHLRSCPRLSNSS